MPSKPKSWPAVSVADSLAHCVTLSPPRPIHTSSESHDVAAMPPSRGYSRRNVGGPDAGKTKQGEGRRCTMSNAGNVMTSSCRARGLCMRTALCTSWRRRHGTTSASDMAGCRNRKPLAARWRRATSISTHPTTTHPTAAHGSDRDRRDNAAPSAAHKIPLFQRNVVQRVVRGHFSEFYFLARSFLVRSTRAKKRK